MKNFDWFSSSSQNLIKLLAVEHPLFIQDIQAMRMPYPKYIERPPTSLIDMVPYVITNGEHSTFSCSIRTN